MCLSLMPKLLRLWCSASRFWHTDLHLLGSFVLASDGGKPEGSVLVICSCIPINCVPDELTFCIREYMYLESKSISLCCPLHRGLVFCCCIWFREKCKYMYIISASVLSNEMFESEFEKRKWDESFYRSREGVPELASRRIKIIRVSIVSTKDWLKV